MLNYLSEIVIWLLNHLLGCTFHLGLSTGRSGSGLCPTRTRPDQIGWPEIQPAADRHGWSDRADRTFNGRRSVQSELEIWKSPKIRRFNGEISVIFSPDFLRIHQNLIRFGEISPDLVRSRQIQWRFHGSSWDIVGNGWDLAGCK